MDRERRDMLRLAGATGLLILAGCSSDDPDDGKNPNTPTVSSTATLTPNAPVSEPPTDTRTPSETPTSTITVPNAPTNTPIPSATPTSTPTDQVPSTTTQTPTRTPSFGRSTLIGDDTENEDSFGNSVALYGDTAIIGAPLDNNVKGESAGSAYVFTYAGGEWSQQEKLIADVENADGSDEKEYFGVDVALDGDTAVVGASSAIHDGERPGLAYVFTRDDETWSQEAKLLAEDGEYSDAFGVAVALDGNTTIIGASNDVNASGDWAGSAYVFARSGDEWTQRAKLLASDGDQRDNFGDAVAIDGGTIVVGAPGDEDPNGEEGGSAYVFSRSGETWSQQAKLVADDGNGSDALGSSVTLDGDTAVIGAPSDEDPNGEGGGSAYVFSRSDRTWSQQAKLFADDGDSNDSFGIAATFNGDTAVIGAHRDEDPNGEEGGSAYVFTSDETWSQQAKLFTDDSIDTDYFGASVTLDSGIIVGAPGGSEIGGSAYVFDLP